MHIYIYMSEVVKAYPEGVGPSFKKKDFWKYICGWPIVIISKEDKAQINAGYIKI